VDLIIPIKMNYGDADCLICSTSISIRDREEFIRCGECGANYILIPHILTADSPELTYTFDGHKCMYSSIGGSLPINERWCSEGCPTARMYCEEHCASSYIDNARGAVSYAQGRVVSAEEKLDKLEESKKIWLMRELSGIDAKEDNDPISDDEVR